MKLTLENLTQLCDKYKAMQHPEELYPLVYYLSQDPPKIILELGVFSGGMIAILKTFFPECEMIGVDMQDPDDPRVLPPQVMEDVDMLKKNIKEFNINYVVGMTQDQSTLDKVSKILNGRKADFMFIDASHDYDSVKRDFTLYSRFAKKVGFHDLHNEIGVYPFWREIRGSYPFALWRAKTGLGIGVVTLQ